MTQHRNNRGVNRPALAIGIVLGLYIVTGILLCRFCGAALLDGTKLSPLGYLFYPIVKIYTALRM